MKMQLYCEGISKEVGIIVKERIGSLIRFKEIMKASTIEIITPDLSNFYTLGLTDSLPLSY